MQIKITNTHGFKTGFGPTWPGFWLDELELYPRLGHSTEWRRLMSRDSLLISWSVQQSGYFYSLTRILYNFSKQIILRCSSSYCKVCQPGSSMPFMTKTFSLDLRFVQCKNSYMHRYYIILLESPVSATAWRIPPQKLCCSHEWPTNKVSSLLSIRYILFV